MADCAAMTGHPMDHGWLPHKPETWPYHYATLRGTVDMQHYIGPSKDRANGQTFDHVLCYPGTRVKIVMVSRFGDVGVTEDLTAESGYGARVKLEDLKDFGDKP